MPRRVSRHFVVANQDIIKDDTVQMPDALIAYARGKPGDDNHQDGPLRKRQRLSRDPDELEYIIVRRTVATFSFPKARSCLPEVPISREASDLLLPAIMEVSPGFYHVGLQDGSSVPCRSLLDTTLEGDDVPLLDLLIATQVTTESNSKRKIRGPGSLWTETAVEVGCREGQDYVRLSITVKWNTTTAPQQISPRQDRRAVLQAVMTAYFSGLGQDDASSAAWSPQDFYSTVHVPVEDTLADLIPTNDLNTELYPFQKRALRWLLHREGAKWSAETGCTQILTSPDTENFPYLFYEMRDAEGEVFFISHLLNIVTKNLEPMRQMANSLRGGILAEEMGLGKTVEMIALISLHKRPKDVPSSVFDPFTLQNVVPSSATLIITPPSILQQWLGELKRHAPGLRVMQYKGIKGHNEIDESELVEIVAAHDVVLTTYNVLSSEIYYSLPSPDRSLRGERKYSIPKSPLMQISFWRVCLDEAQMVESGVSNAAVVAMLIPRVHAWGISGTPVKKDVRDLLGLLIFLRVEPYASKRHIWNSLVTNHRPAFKSLFKRLAMRHTKHLVRDELRLPPQQRFVITVSFTPIEEQYYQSLYTEMCSECGLDGHGAPLTENWDGEDPVVLDKMRSWLVRLRQTALHPEVGGRNRRALGNKGGPLRTVDQVLDAMLEQGELTLRTDQRTLLLSKLKRGQLLENGPRVKEALAIWENALRDSRRLVLECREGLRRETEAVDADGNGKSTLIASDDSSENETISLIEKESSEVTTRFGALRNRLRGALELEHIAVFYCANAHFQIKSNEEFTKPGTQEFKDLEILETEGYETAKEIRKQILKEILTKTSKLMRRLSKKASSQAFVQIPEFPSSPKKGGIESQRILGQLEILGIALDAQANQIDEWRESTITFLLRPLVDEEDQVDITGDEYEASTRTQEEVMVFIQALRALVEDRSDLLSGQINLLVRNEVTSALVLAGEGKGAFPEKSLELLKIRDQMKPTKEMGSIRAVLSDLRTLATKLRVDAETGSDRAMNELSIVDHQRKKVQKQFNEQTRAVEFLRKELDLFTALMNSRLEYYRQLQQVSDMVAPYEGAIDPRIFMNMLAEEQRIGDRIASASAKQRYLHHLRKEAADPQEQRLCVICQSAFDVGALTVCGHQFCKECISMWWHSHHNCPVCKKKLRSLDLHDITYKPKDLRLVEEEIIVTDQERSTPKLSSTIYSNISTHTLSQIKDIELNGPSFGTKVDTIARHLIWLRQSDPGNKSIIFSQFKEFLDILSRAFTAFRIGFTTIDKKDGIERFKQDPAMETFLLHSRAHSSGLNLVNASHVFLCEPLINTALELQAIARVDRIGQQQSTSVYLYVVEGTVEQAIYDISLNRRMEHMGRKIKGKSKESTPELQDSSIEAANSMEMEQASLSKLLAKGRSGGEMVEKGDLWACLFSQTMQKRGKTSALIQRQVARHLGADAAEKRHMREPADEANDG